MPIGIKSEIGAIPEFGAAVVSNLTAFSCFENQIISGAFEGIVIIRNIIIRTFIILFTTPRHPMTHDSVVIANKSTDALSTLDTEYGMNTDRSRTEIYTHSLSGGHSYPNDLCPRVFQQNAEHHWCYRCERKTFDQNLMT